MISKLLLLLILVAVLTSLGSALYYLVRDSGAGEHTVRSLTWRTLLSIALFLLLLLAFSAGLLRPHAPVFSPPAPETAHHQ